MSNRTLGLLCMAPVTIPGLLFLVGFIWDHPWQTLITIGIVIVALLFIFGCYLLDQENK